MRFEIYVSQFWENWFQSSCCLIDTPVLWPHYICIPLNSDISTLIYGRIHLLWGISNMTGPFANSFWKKGEGEVRMYSFFVVWKQVEWFAARPMLTNASITKPPVCCFCPLCLTAVPTTNSWQQTNVQICNSTKHNEPRLHHTGKCICTYTDIAIQAFKHNLSNATAYTQSSHI